MIKMADEFKLAVVHFARPNPMQILCMRVDLPLDKRTVENQDWATAPPGRRASGLRGRRGPLGRGPTFSKTL